MVNINHISPLKISLHAVVHVGSAVMVDTQGLHGNTGRTQVNDLLKIKGDIFFLFSGRHANIRGIYFS